MDETLKYSQQKKKAKVLILPGFRKEFSYEYIIEELPRGEHIFHRFLVRTGDILGLVEKEKAHKSESKIIVYPAYTELLYRSFENPFRSRDDCLKRTGTA